MGRKVSPIALRIGINKTWKSNWYSNKKEYGSKLVQDVRVRKYLKKKLYRAGISSIEIERMGSKTRITLFTSKPGVVIGKKGSEVEKLKLELRKITGTEILLVIKEVKKIELDATLVAENIAMQLEKRVAFRRAMKKAVLQTMKANAEGIKVMVAGRLAGAEMARTEWYIRGRVPLHTLRADIDYGTAEAYTTYGLLGVKVWICKGEILDTKKETLETEEQEAGGQAHVNA